MIRTDSFIPSVIALILPCVACGPTTGRGTEETYVATGGTSGSGSATSTGGSGGITLDAGDVGGSAGSAGGVQISEPVRSLEGLVSMTFFERTGGSMPTAYTFAVNGTELTARLADPLSAEQFDISGADTEYYDVYYSDKDGEFDIDGSYLTISGTFEMSAPLGGGLNLAEIALNYSGKPAEFGNYVASFASHGDNKDDASIEKCIDGDLLTETTMGNTIGASSRLRLTLGFLSSSGPPPPVH